MLLLDSDLPPSRAVPPHSRSPHVIRTATAEDRERIYAARHAIYAAEMGQHPINHRARLSDAIDAHNVYLVAETDAADLAGFISITLSTAPSFSLEKYFARTELPCAVNTRTYEVRLLTVVKPRRGSELAYLLMYAALRWVEAHGGETIVGIGRGEIMEFYARNGMRGTGKTVASGRVTYELMHASVADLRHRCRDFPALHARLEARTQWRLPFGFAKPAACFHGGASFAAIGESFDDLGRRSAVINADVLDAWFPPAPGVVHALATELPWLLRTSPPTDAGGMVAAIARARDVGRENILPGAGSSDLIFRALRHWLNRQSRVLLLDPTYGEYAHVLEDVIGCAVERFPLHSEDGFVVDVEQLGAALGRRPDLAILVNPNSPTGRHVSRAHLEAVLRQVPSTTRVWVDETYVDYVGGGESLERFAAESENVVVCKSMSKVYALSGARIAYLCAGAHQLEGLRAITPPWVVGLPSQLAAVRALEDREYYQMRYRETRLLRTALSAALSQLGWGVIPGVANFLLCRLPAGELWTAQLSARCQTRGLFLRDVTSMGSTIPSNYVRIAVKDEATNRRMLAIISEAMCSG